MIVFMKLFKWAILKHVFQIVILYLKCLYTRQATFSSVIHNSLRYTKRIIRLKIIEGKNMPKPTVFAKKETGTQIGTSNSAEVSSLSVQKTDLLEINLFDSEKPGPNSVEQTPNEVSAQKKFNEYLIEAVDEALTSLGEPVKNTVYFQLENNFNIPKNEIPDQIDEFTNILHKIFGLGASRLEIKFMKNLYSKIKINVETPWV